jgi:hypothetical protein
MSLTLDDFANRFEYLKQYTDTSTQMIHDLLSYSRKLETTLQQETQQLNDELRDCRLDLTDAIKTRRELQQQVLALKENELLILDQNNSLKVGEAELPLIHSFILIHSPHACKRLTDCVYPES